MEEERINENQVYWHVSRLRNWEKNNQARMITTENWNKLVASVKRIGIKNSFEIDNQGVVYDGNNRLKALLYWINQGVTHAENGKELAWVPIRLSNPQTEAQKWELAFLDNGQYAQWNQDKLPNFLPEFESELDLPLLNISFFDPKSIDEQLVSRSEQQKGTKQAKEVQCPNCQHIFIPTH